MVNWVPLQSTLNTFRGGTWASDITYFNGKFYIYTTEVSMSRGNVGPLNMAQRSLLGVPFKDQDGNRYLFFNKGMMIKLAPDSLSVEGDVIFKTLNSWD